VISGYPYDYIMESLGQLCGIWLMGSLLGGWFAGRAVSLTLRISRADKFIEVSI